jgi:hypothetical protein
MTPPYRKYPASPGLSIRTVARMEAVRTYEGTLAATFSDRIARRSANTVERVVDRVPADVLCILCFPG